MDYDIFREELALKYPSYGYALWNPSPQGRYYAVQVGDVGFIHRGYFHRLFNILLPRDHPSHRDTAPPHHEPLEVNINMPPDYTSKLPRNHFRSNGVSDTSSVDRHLASEQSRSPLVGFSDIDPNGPDPAAIRHYFSCSNKQGALLSLPLPAQRDDTIHRRTFKKFMVEHIDEWFAFAQGLGLEINRKGDIILVTGRDLARSWANIAFLERNQKVSFGVRVSRHSDVEWEFTPEGAGGAALNLGPSGQDLPEDQCIFVRSIRVTTIRQKLPWLRGAGPRRMPGEFDPDPDIELGSTPEDTHDPLHTLLEYISTQAPDCDIALVHDEDLEYIASASLKSLRPDAFMSYLRKSAPEILQVEFDLTCGSPTSHGNKLASKHKAMPQISKVAMLSSAIAYDDESIISQNERNIINERITLSPSIHQNLPPNAEASTTQSHLRGGKKLELGRGLAVAFEPLISEDAHRDKIIEKRITSPPQYDLQTSATAIIATTLIKSLLKQLPSGQEKRGDHKLELARDLAIEFESLISDDDRRIIEERITFAREAREGLDARSGFSKLLKSREYRSAAREAYRCAKSASERARDVAAFAHPLDTPSGTSSQAAPEGSFDRVLREAQSLYRCYLSCKEAFPSPNLMEEWVAVAWSEACSRTGIYPIRLPCEQELACSNMRHIANIKATIMHHVESLYGFDTSRTPDSISRNARGAQALLTNMSFIYNEPNIGGTPHHPYRHPIIQKVINITWFQNKDSDGIVLHEYFNPMPIQAIALALTVVECCIDEWTGGTRKDSNWDEQRYKTVYFSHISSLNDLRNHGRPQGEDLLAHIQHGLLKNARVHAGAPPELVTGTGRLLPQDLDIAISEDLPAYFDNDNPMPVIVVDDEL